MRKALFLAATAALLTAGTSAGATSWIINLDGVANAVGGDSAADALKAVTQHLAAGQYRVTFTEGQYTAFNRFGAVEGCQAGGVQCVKGWENSAIIGIGGLDQASAIFMGDAGATGDYGPNGDAYFSSAAQSLAHAATYVQNFTLSADSDVYFVLADRPNQLRDNVGGVSLLVEAVPEPATWAMLVAGFGLVGLGARRRRVLAES